MDFYSGVSFRVGGAGLRWWKWISGLVVGFRVDLVGWLLFIHGGMVRGGCWSRSGGWVMVKLGLRLKIHSLS